MTNEKKIEEVIDSRKDTSALLNMVYEPYWTRFWLRMRFYGV